MSSHFWVIQLHIEGAFAVWHQIVRPEICLSPVVYVEYQHECTASPVRIRNCTSDFSPLHFQCDKQHNFQDFEEIFSRFQESCPCYTLECHGFPKQIVPETG